jgi:hypothetical protein
MMMCRVTSKESLASACLEVLLFNPPPRTITSKLFCRLYRILGLTISQTDRERMLNTLKGLGDLIQAHIKKNGHEVALRFKDFLVKDLDRKFEGQPEDTEIKSYEVRRSVCH